MNRTSSALLLAALLPLAACGAVVDPDDAADETSSDRLSEPFPDDAWLRPEWQRPFGREDRRPPTSYRLVPAAELAAANAKLEQESVVVLTPAEAARFGAEVLAPPAPTDVPVQLRALLAGGEPDPELPEGVPGKDLLVYHAGDVVCVESQASRDPYCPQLRSAVVAWLPGVPREVCVRALIVYHGGVR